MSASKTVREIDEELARRINDEARRDPNSPYANKFVGIANGQVVVVADTQDEMSRRLRELEPDPQKCFCLEARLDYDEVIEIWPPLQDRREAQTVSDSKTIQDRNEEPARKIHQEAQRDPHSPYANKCVGIVDGRVVAVADDWDELFLRLRQIEPDPENCFSAWIDPSTHFGAENEIWGLH
jgi:hypothetical protein